MFTVFKEKESSHNVIIFFLNSIWNIWKTTKEQFLHWEHRKECTYSIFGNKRGHMKWKVLTFRFFFELVMKVACFSKIFSSVQVLKQYLLMCKWINWYQTDIRRNPFRHAFFGIWNIQLLLIYDSLYFMFHIGNRITGKLITQPALL